MVGVVKSFAVFPAIGAVGGYGYGVYKNLTDGYNHGNDLFVDSSTVLHGAEMGLGAAAAYAGSAYFNHVNKFAHMAGELTETQKKVLQMSGKSWWM